MKKRKTYSLTLTQVNEALGEYSPLLHPLAERRLKANLNICIQWASKTADRSKPKNCFRDFATLKLGPESNFPVLGSGQWNESEIRGFDDWMRCLHMARCEELDVETIYGSDEEVNLAGGRLLVMEPAATTSTGVSSVETEHFLDVDDCPPIGLWIDYISTPKVVQINDEGGLRYLRNEGYILSFIPHSFVESVQAGIDVNAEDCIYWLEDQQHVSGEIIRSWI